MMITTKHRYVYMLSTLKQPGYFVKAGLIKIYNCTGRHPLSTFYAAGDTEARQTGSL